MTGSVELRIGDPAPDFTLRQTFTKDIRLGEILARGPVVLLFYVFDFGVICGGELREFNERASEIHSHGASIVGVAVSPTFAQQAFAASLDLSFPLLSDWERTVCSAYGVQYTSWKGHSGVAKRAVFVLDSAGIVRGRWVTDDAYETPPIDPVIGTLRDMSSRRPSGDGEN